jgi:parvulin-like peptidyl-prolyl isomerase
MKKPKLKKLKAKLPKQLPRPLRRSKATEERFAEALQSVPRITNETVAQHREAVLSSARKYIYPLQHSKHRVVRTSISLLVIVLIAFFVYCGTALYNFQSTSGFIYGVVKVIPFPIGKVGPSWVSYESYLFELRRNMHYYQTQQAADFSTKGGKAQLSLLKEQAMSQVIQNAYVKQLAQTYHVSVSAQAINNEVELVRNENRLGSNNQVFKEVLNEFWGWDENDFKRELGQQLLQQAVVDRLDVAANARAKLVLKLLNSGTPFATLAGQYSDDASTKSNGGAYGTAITPNDPNIAPAITAELFQLELGQTSGIINTGYTLEILKVLSSSSGSVQAAHIQFTLKPITTYIAPLKAKEKTHLYIKV